MLASRASRRDHRGVQLWGQPGAVEDELVERSRELELLSECLAAVDESARGHAVFLSGEAGIGKTALLRRFCDELGAGVRVLWAACDPLYAPRPLGPLLDVARITNGEFRERVQRGAKPHDVATALIAELEPPGPTVLVLEDLHWADEATLDVVRLVGGRLRAVPVLLLGSYRDEQLDRSHPLRILLGELPGRGAVTRLELEGLSRSAIAALAEPSGLDAAELYDRTAGNPFFVTEALAAGTVGVPQTVRDAVLARAARLSSSARALLDAVAVVPQRVELWLLEALVDGQPDGIDECLGSGMLTSEADSVAFRHELARLVVEESLTPGRRVALHRCAVAAIEASALGARDLARLAHHAEAAGDADAVLRVAPAAAEQASSVDAHREAQRQYGRAIRFAHAIAPEARADLLERFAAEGYLTDMREEAVDALGEALAIHRARGDISKQGDALRLRSRLLTCLGRTEEARALSREAVAVLEQAPPGPALARAYSAMSGDAMMDDDAEATISWGRRAIALAEDVGDTQALVDALCNVGTIELARGIESGHAALERSLALALQTGRGPDVGRAYINFASVFVRRREWGKADRHLDAGIGFCRERGLEAWSSCLLAERAGAELGRGRWTDAADTARWILESAPRAAVQQRHAALLALALVRARRGDPEYWPLLDEALEIARAAESLGWLAPVAAARAEAAWLEGRTDAIAPETDAAFDLALERREPWSVGELASWRRRAGVLAEPPAGAAEPYRLELSGAWRQAAAIWRELGCPYDEALALADSGDEEALREAHETLRALGAGPATAIVSRRLRERGVRGVPRGPRSRTRENPHGLTARELDVLKLLALGLRNAQIAGRLIVSEKTVDHHVSAILRKLDVGTRGEAAAEARRLGIAALG